MRSADSWTSATMILIEALASTAERVADWIAAILAAPLAWLRRSLPTAGVSARA